MTNKKILSKEQIIEAISHTDTMGGAAKFLSVDWRTFKKYAEKYSLYSPRSSGGIAYDLNDILNGKYPQYPTSKLSKRLVSSGYKKYKCEHCGISDYNSKPISLELDHIDGNNSNHSLSNLRLLCPNCHSQTPTYKSKKIKLDSSVHGDKQT